MSGVTSALKPLTLWSHWGAPNPYKVLMVLEILHLPYILHPLEFSEVKSPAHLGLNPNGRLPTLEDPNTGIVLWESGAIVLYLVDQYDKAGNISYTTFPEKWHAMQWLAFQISGQGPYTGQATWFSRFHPDPLPSATARYVTEIVRVISVLNEGLQRNNTGWLVGDKCTFADLAFRTWAEVGEGVLREQGKIKEVDAFGKYKAWIGEMDGMKEVRRVMEKMEEGRKTHGLA